MKEKKLLLTNTFLHFSAISRENESRKKVEDDSNLCWSENKILFARLVFNGLSLV